MTSTIVSIAGKTYFEHGKPVVSHTLQSTRRSGGGLDHLLPLPFWGGLRLAILLAHTPEH